MTATRAFLGMSHSPLMGLNPIASTVQDELDAAIGAARRLATRYAPELIVLVAPDHYNGFFNELMPPFCIGSKATSVGDYLTPAGRLNVDERAAIALTQSLMDSEFDVALSRDMRVDHGFAQSLQLLWGSLDTPPVLPVFMNAVAAPGIPRLGRCWQLGRAIGRFLDTLPQRTLLIGSGGLSHEPPVPTWSNATPQVRERILIKHTPTREERDAKTARVMAAGQALAAGKPGIKALNPAWDRSWMDAIRSDRPEALADLSEASIDTEGGLSAHESKSWLVARSALASARTPTCELSFYQAIPEYIAGFGLLWLSDD